MERRRDAGEGAQSGDLAGHGTVGDGAHGAVPQAGPESRLERQLFEMKVHAELQRRDLEASGIGYPALLGARSRFYLLEDDSALVDVMTRLEMYRRRHLN